VFHTTFSFTHVRPRKRKIDGWEFWKTCRGFLDGKTITSKGLGMREKGEKMALENGNWKFGKKDFRRAMGD